MRRKAILMVSCAVLSTACEDTSTNMSLRWSFGSPGRSCREAGVQTVHVFVGPLAPQGIYDHEIDCTYGESGVRLENIGTGSHTLVLKAVAAGRLRYALTQEILVAENADLGERVLPPYVPPTE